MATWKNLDTLASYDKLKNLKNHVNIAEAMSGEKGAERVMNYSTPMAAGLTYNYAAKQVDKTVLDALAELADEAQLIDKFQELYNGAVINTGTISDSGEMTGHPLMFYLSGKDISTVRFSCKNQQINFMDWTEKRDEFGLAQNFTVSYGEDESEYYYLLIDWVPNATIRELTDNEDSTIAALPEEMRNDIIVMEITFENGKTLTKAITVSLLEDGTFFAKFDDYEITAEDSFIDRPDSEAIGAAPVIEDNYKEADPNEPEQIVIPNSITFTGTIIDNVIESLVPIILVDVEENSGLSYDKVLFELTEEQKDWELKIGTRVQIVCSDIFQESTPPIGNLISITEAAPNDELKIADEAARAYYENTVFEVVSLELKSQTENEISFSVCVSKGGIVQEPDRTIFLEFVNGHWEVVNEGY